jgi:hypothetical protein
MTDDDTLGMKLSKCLFEHEPKLLTADLNASVLAAKEVANLLGCIMATFLVKKGEDDYLECMKMIGQFVDQSARRTADKAENMPQSCVTEH